MKRKIFFASFLAVLLLAGAVLADESTPPIKDTYEIDGITYYNVNSKNFESDKKFWEDILSTKHSSLGNRSMAELWMILAVGLDNNVIIPDTTRSSTIREAAKQAALKGVGQGTVSYNGVPYSYTYTAPTWNNNGHVETTLNLINSTSPFLIIMRFSDFGVGVVLPGETSHYVSTTVENDNVKGEQAASAKNDSNNTVSIGQQISKSTTESLTSTINHSFAYGFKETVKVGVGFDAGIFKIAGEIGFEANQTITDGWTKSQGTTKTSSTTNSINITLPPYTNALIKQGESNAKVTTKYNCPVFVSYKVYMAINDGVFLYRTYRTFGPNARENLNKRAFVDVDYDEQSVNWRTVFQDSDYQDAAKKITTHVPMSQTGATMVYTNHTTYNEVSGIAALYPLAAVDLGKCNVSFINNDAKKATMKVGNYSYTNYLNVEGYNAQGGAYYGFNKNNGRWVVVGADGQELPESSAPIVIEKSSVSGQTKFKAVRPGNCALKYLINENSYPSAIGATTYTQNSDLSRTATLDVEVLEDEVTYEITGDFSGTLNSPPKSIEGDGKLKVSIFDATGKEVERPYRWEARELRGINLQENGMVNFTEVKTFHVRVTSLSGSTYSAWKAIWVEALGDDYVADDTPPAFNRTADENTSLIISGNYIGGLSSDAEPIEGIGKLTVTAYDSTGQEEPVAYTWEAQEGVDGITLTADGVVSFTKTGAYYVRVKSGEFYSDWFEITAKEKAPAIITHKPAAMNNPYDETEQELVNHEARFEGGIRMLYGLGENETTEPNEYSSEIPTAINAGTYYVWYKVQGDEKHENSEPEVVSVTISASSSGDDDGKKDDEPKETVGSKGGGCNSLGFGFEIFAAAALFILKRKSS